MTLNELVGATIPDNFTIQITANLELPPGPPYGRFSVRHTNPNGDVEPNLEARLAQW